MTYTFTAIISDLTTGEAHVWQATTLQRDEFHLAMEKVDRMTSHDRGEILSITILPNETFALET